MKKLLPLALILMGLLSTTLSRAADSTAIADLQRLLHAEEEARPQLENDLFKAKKDLQSNRAVKGLEQITGQTLQLAQSKIDDAENYLIENHLRIEFLNNYISALQKGSDNARKDSENILLDLSHKQSLGKIESGSETNLGKFELFLSIAIRDILEPSENFGAFVKRYMIWSSIKEPKQPQEFLKEKERAYIGGDTDTTTPHKGS